MATSSKGVGRSVPAEGKDGQVPAIDTTAATTDDLSWQYNGRRTSPATKTSAYTAKIGEVVAGDTTSAGFTVTLPTPVKGQPPVTVFRIAGSNNITVAGTINGSTNTTVSTVAKTFVALDDATGYVAF